MKFIIVFTLLCSLSVALCDISCSDPSSSKDTYQGESQECVALVKAKCDGMTNFRTSAWKRGKKVKDNCSSISRYTAVATFTAPKNKYRGHAAIFESCDSNGVWVWDQWKGQKVHRRQMRYGSSNNWPSNDGSELYTIEK